MMERPCFAVRMVFDVSGHKRRHEFLRGIMRSAARLTYKQAQMAFDGSPDGTTAHLQEKVMQPLWNAFRALAQARDKRGLRSTLICRNGASSSAPTVKSNPSVIASGWNPCG